MVPSLRRPMKRLNIPEAWTQSRLVLICSGRVARVAPDAQTGPPQRQSEPSGKTIRATLPPEETRTGALLRLMATTVAPRDGPRSFHKTTLKATTRTPDTASNTGFPNKRSTGPRPDLSGIAGLESDTRSAMRGGRSEALERGSLDTAAVGVIGAALR